MRLSIALLVAVCIVSAGCGGGGGSSVSDSTTQSFSGYNIKATYQAKAGVQPTVISNGISSGAAFTGLFGVSFTQVQTTQTPTLGNTRIGFSRAGELWMMNGDFSNEVPVTKQYVNVSNSCTPAIHPNGRIAAISRIDNAGYFEIYFASLDGSSLTKMTTRTAFCLAPVWSPNGSVCAFHSYDPVSGHQQIYAIPSTGGTPTRLSDGTADDTYPCFSLDGSKIYFRRFVSTNNYVYMMNANGSSPGPSPVGVAFNAADKIALSPDGTSLITGDGTSLDIFSATGGTGHTFTIPVSGTTFSSPSFSPDGRYIMYQAVTSSGTQIITANFDGTSPSAQTPVGDYEDPVWGPFPQNRNIIGSGSYLATGASGFLMGEAGDRLISFLAFTTTTPSTANIVAQSATADNTVFQLKGDAITKLAFFNDIYSTATVIVPVSGMTSIGGALVSFNSTTGKVVLVAPYSPGTAKVASSKTGMDLTYTGSFAGIWNANGKNLALKGASSVTIASKTGVLLSFH